MAELNCEIRVKDFERFSQTRLVSCATENCIFHTPDWDCQLKQITHNASGGCANFKRKDAE